MFFKSLKYLILLLLSCSTLLFTQTKNGILYGTVVDQTTGEKLIGANILIEGTQLGATSDMDGRYRIKNVPPGTYTIRASFISYKTRIFTNVEAGSDKQTELNITLEPGAISTVEVVVTQKIDKSYEGALLNYRKNSNSITDGISAQTISKTTDANTADALKRVPSVTIMDNKFVYIRGTSDRYSGALLNNSPMASVEPDKKSFAFDLIPSKLIESTTIVKSFTPDLPGDFAGGLVNITTVDIPNSIGLSLSYESKYIADVTSKNYSTYDNGGKNFTGLDNGFRGLPNGFPTDIDALSKNQTDSLAKTLKNNWIPQGKAAPVNHSFSLAYSDIFSLFGNDLGLISSLTYKTKTNSQNVILNDFLSKDNYGFNFDGKKSVQNVFWGGILNLGYKFSDFSKLFLKNSFSVNADDEVSELEGYYAYYSAYQKKLTYRYISRWLVNTQLLGESYLPYFNGIKIDYSASYSKSLRDEPDYHSLIYWKNNPEDKYQLQIPTSADGNSGSRLYSMSKENVRSLGLNIELPVSFIKLKFGSSYKYSDRSFDTRLLGFYAATSPSRRILNSAPDSVFAAKNFYYGGLSLGEFSTGTNSYIGINENTAFYGMVEIPFKLLEEDFKIVTGLRNENYLLRIHTFSRDKQNLLNDDNVENNLLYSFNLIYSLNNNSKIRFAIAKTVNRPEYREIVPFQYYDFQIQASTYGNPELQTAKIMNYDLRFETYPGASQIFSISPFYKEIRNPIERTIVPVSGSNPGRTFMNSGFAKVFGFEVEGRSSLAFISDLVSDFNINLNYSWAKSEVKEILSLNDIRIRPLQGQSKYVINAGLNYINEDYGIDVNLTYYCFGERVIEVAVNSTLIQKDQLSVANITEKPRNLVDLVISKTLTKYLSLKASWKDILAEDSIFEQYTSTLRKFQNHSEYSVGLSLNL